MPAAMKPSPATPVRELRTERLLLRRGDSCDLDAIRAFFVRNVGHLAPWLPQAEAIATDPAFAEALQERSEAEQAAGCEERWFLAPPGQPDRVIGYVFLTRFRRDEHRSCEVAYGLDADETGRGLMSEAVRRMIAHACDHLGFTRIDARYAVDNEASARLLERLGFVRVGIAPQHAWVNGAWRDHVLVTRVDR